MVTRRQVKLQQEPEASFISEDRDALSLVIKSFVDDIDDADVTEVMTTLFPESDPNIDLINLKGDLIHQNLNGTFSLNSDYDVKRVISYLRQVLEYKGDSYRSAKNFALSLLLFYKGRKYFDQVRNLLLSRSSLTLSETEARSVGLTLNTAKNLYSLIDTRRLSSIMKVISTWYRKRKPVQTPKIS